MKEFRQTLERLVPDVIYQEQWLGETCFNLHFISKMIELMQSQGMVIAIDDMDAYARMPIDVMVEKRPHLLRMVLTAIRKDKIKSMETKAPIPTIEI